jgi:hypothetical protein
MKKLKVPM